MPRSILSARRFFQFPVRSSKREPQPQPDDVVTIVGIQSTSSFDSERHPVAEPIVHPSSKIDPGPSIEPVLRGSGSPDTHDDERNEAGYPCG